MTRKKASVWLTYAWADNASQDVDFVAQELATVVKVHLDRWNLVAGKRLWDQIADFISNPDKSDAWILFATQASLGSEPCKEEFAYALDRALRSRGSAFPVIGLFPGPVESELIPPAIRSRLYLSLTDPDWKERIEASAEGRDPKIGKTFLQPYYIHLHQPTIPRGYAHAIEVRPRAGIWSPFVFAIPSDERSEVSPYCNFGPPGRPDKLAGVIPGVKEFATKDGKWWAFVCQVPASPIQSYYLFCKKLPSTLVFGNEDAQPQFTVQFPPPGFSIDVCSMPTK